MTTRWFVRNVPVDFNLKSGLTSLKLAALAPRLAGCAVRELGVAIASDRPSCLYEAGGRYTTFTQHRTKHKMFINKQRNV